MSQTEYDPSWPDAYSSEAHLIEPAFGPRLVAMEHVGSTAIPGMAAKPIVDILAAVHGWDAFDDLVDALASLDYVYTPHSEADDSGRRVFRKPSDLSLPRTHHLHVTTVDSDYWRRILAFRDRLRAEPSVAAEYRALKRRLAVEFADDPDSYTRGKAAFVRAHDGSRSESIQDAPAPATVSTTPEPSTRQDDAEAPPLGVDPAPINVYMAADFARAAEADALADQVREAGLVVVSRWHRIVDGAEAAAARAGTAPAPAEALAAAERNLDDLALADVLVVLTTGSAARGGRHFETGFAYAARKHVVVVGPPEHAFHHLDGVVSTDEVNLVPVLRALRPTSPHDGPGTAAAACLVAQGFEVPVRPTLDVADHLHDLWLNLLAEERDELRDAVAAGDIVEVADALADIVYVALSAGASYGLPMDEVVAEVHRSNLTKIGADGAVKYRDDGKVLKPATFSPPNIARVLGFEADSER
ncbi:MAG TPA: GrpB family protein [Acidimicrobiales bacterium]|nr:GrpB family protein [Acidimicrobiales bacterium]